MTSREKLEHLLAEFKAGRGPGGSGPLALGLRTVLMVPPFKDALREVLAKDPGELDEMLEWAARQVLQLRSDDARELVALAVCVEDPPVVELPGA